jgi:hypothetical protein
MKLVDHPFHKLGVNVDLVKRFSQRPPGELHDVLKKISRLQTLKLHPDASRTEQTRSSFQEVESAYSQVEEYDNFLSWLSKFQKIKSVSQSVAKDKDLEAVSSQLTGKINSLYQVISRLIRGFLGFKTPELNSLDISQNFRVLVQPKHFGHGTSGLNEYRVIKNQDLFQQRLKVISTRESVETLATLDDDWVLTPLYTTSGKPQPMISSGYKISSKDGDAKKIKMRIIGSVARATNSEIQTKFPAIDLKRKSNYQVQEEFDRGRTLEEFMPMMNNFDTKLENGKDLVAVSEDNGEIYFYNLGEIRQFKKI